MARCWSRGATATAVTWPARSCTMSAWASALLAAADCHGHLAARSGQQPGAHRLAVPGRLRRFGRQYCKIRRRIIRWCNCAALENGQTLFLLSTNWSTNSFTSAPVWISRPARRWRRCLSTASRAPAASSTSAFRFRPRHSDRRPNTGQRLVPVRFHQQCGALFGVLATTNLALPLSQLDGAGRRHGNLARPVPVHRLRRPRIARGVLPRVLAVIPGDFLTKTAYLSLEPSPRALAQVR